MPDNKTKKKRDRLFIATGEPYEVQAWAHAFEVTPAQLRAAVIKVGNKVADVRRWLAAPRFARKLRELTEDIERSC